VSVPGNGVRRRVEEAAHQWPANADGVRWVKGGCVADAEPALVVVRTFHDVAVSCLSTGLEW
jgi:hypothetical protein